MTRFLASLLTILFLVIPQRAQSQTGGLFLLVPMGAKAVGQGEAVVADSTLGTEGLWWNPAASARSTKRELAVHHSVTFGATSDMLAFLIPSKVMGTFSGAFYLVNYGDMPVTDAYGNQTGIASTHNYLGALSYSSALTSRLSAGLSYKFINIRFACSGACGEVPVFSGTSSALDLGLQYLLPTSFPVVLGATLRNVGPNLQVKDADQSDPLPKQLQLGVRAALPIEAFTKNNSSVAVMADYKAAAALGGAAFGLGSELGYRDEFFLRFGYYRQPGLGGGPSIGFGATQGNISIDLSRRFDEFSSQTGTTPTFISMRVRF